MYSYYFVIHSFSHIYVHRSLQTVTTSADVWLQLPCQQPALCYKWWDAVFGARNPQVECLVNVYCVQQKMYSREVFPVEIYSQWLRILQEYFTHVFYFINMPDYKIVFNCLKIGRSYAILCTPTLW